MASVIKVENDGTTEYLLLNKELKSLGDVHYQLFSVHEVAKLVAEKSGEWTKEKKPLNEQVMSRPNALTILT